MKKKGLIYLIVAIICLFSCNYSVNAEFDAGKGNTDNKGDNKGNTSRSGGLKNYRDIGVRVTIYDSTGIKVSNSVDVVFAQEVYNDFIGANTYNTLSSEYRAKLDYNRGHSVNWEKNSLRDKIIVETNHSSQRADIPPSDNKLPENVLLDNIKYWYNNIDIETKKIFPVKTANALSVCQGKYKCDSSKTYYAVFEPTLYIISAGQYYYGTAYELAYKFMTNNNKPTLASSVSNLDNWINNSLPRLLVTAGRRGNIDFYNNVGLSKFCVGNEKTCLGNPFQINRIDILNSGVGIGVYDWPVDKTLLINIKCDVNVDINECGDSSIYEANYNGSINNKECIVDNAAYSYISGCNLYCSDEITTDFKGFYGTFIGNNALGAIKSGKYVAIKSNPKITIKKTCYQSKASNECPDVSGSFRNKLQSDYGTNKIYLNVDGKKYEFIGNSTITNNGYSNATITYEYKLDSNTNKYIDIETMKGVLNPSNITYTNEGPMIITTKGYYGKYTYNFDVSETPLNKYTSSSAGIRKLTNTQSTKYNFKNGISINYKQENNNKKSTYTNEDLKNTTCSYFKYNTDTSCIGEENKCVDSVTCETVECPPNPNGETCECTGKYGCLDDGKCTPIKEPKSDDKEVCDPEEKTCFPDLIYRPISLVEPFPGINGKGRTPGNNWNKIYKTADGRSYSYGDYYIRLRRGYKDYEIYQAEPLYVIKLDGKKIQAIRKYNDNHNYNDFELECINGENCISKFLRGNAQDFNINLIESGTCKNINSHNFDSCIKNKGE